MAASKESSANGDKNGSHDPTGDTAFMDSVMSSITNRHGEAAIRSKFRAWVYRFTLIATAFEELVYGASALAIGANETDNDVYGFGVSGHGLVWTDEGSKIREIQANVGRVEGWRQSRSYFSLIRDLARMWKKGESVRGLDMMHQVDRLRSLRVGDAVAADIYVAIHRAVERAGIEPEDDDFDDPINPDDPPSPIDDEMYEDLEMRLLRRDKARYDVINQLLCALPESGGGLFPISLGLFHKDPNVRMAVVSLLERVKAHEAGRHFWVGLGRFAKLAFFRIKGEMEAKERENNA